MIHREHEANYQAWSELYDISPTDANHNAFTCGWEGCKKFLLSEFAPMATRLDEVLAKADEAVLGYADNGAGISWPVRDELRTNLGLFIETLGGKRTTK